MFNQLDRLIPYEKHRVREFDMLAHFLPVPLRQDDS